MFGFTKKHNTVYEVPEPLSVRGRALKVFSKIEALDDIKGMMMLRALESPERAHTLLIGPPACAKSLFMLEIEKFLGTKVYFAEGAATTKAGIQKFIAESQIQNGLFCNLSNNLYCCCVTSKLTFFFRYLNVTMTSNTLELDLAFTYAISFYSSLYYDILPILKIKIIIATILCLCAISFLVYGTSTVNITVYAQSDLQTIKYRNLVIDLGNGVKTNAQLTYPAIGKGPFPGVLLIHGSGANDKNETLGYVHKNGPKPPTLLWQIAQYLSERGFAVLRYDKRGVGGNYTILDSNVWGNSTANDLIQDSKKALNILIQQPEVDPKNISIIGHSEGTLYAPRVAIDNPTKVKNIILMGILAQNASVSEYNLDVSLPSEYATKVLDKDHTGMISIEQIANAPVLRNSFVPSSVLSTNNTKEITNTLAKAFGTSGDISIDKQLKPALVKIYQNTTAFNLHKCTTIALCPILWRSLFSMVPNLSIIGNVSKSTGILILNGQNDTQTPVEQAFLLQQRLTEVNHPDHTLITYPNLGHAFYPSSHWVFEIGPIEPYVLADLYSWLESHSGFTRIPVVMPSSNSSSSSSTTTK